MNGGGELGYVRGAFIAYEPSGYPDKKRVIPFRFNPELLSRSLNLQTGSSGGGVEGASAPTSGGGEGENAAEPGSATGGVTESFSVTIRLDFADRDNSVSRLDEEFGVAPEIAAIEDLLYPAESESDAPSDGSEPVRAAAPRPVVLFVWGRKRVVPVQIKSLKIDESVFNNHLNPVRAEIEASLEVLSSAEALAHEGVKAATAHTWSARRELARMYYDNTASQGSNILEL